MPQLSLYHLDGKTRGQIKLPDTLFAARINPQLMAQAVRVYLANQRRALAKTKNRGEVKLTTKKAYRQKGTGRARHGAKSAPIFVGGGIAHGPTGEQNYHLTMPQKMRQAALASALTSKFKDKQVTVMDGVDEMTPKTKVAVQILQKLNLENDKVTLVLPQKTEVIMRSFRNLAQVSLQLAYQLNTYKVLNGGILLFTKEAAVHLGATLVTEARKKEPSVPKAADKVDSTISKKRIVEKSKTKKIPVSKISGTKKLKK